MTAPEADEEEIPLFRIDWDAAEVKHAIDSITRGSHWANGPYVDRFEAVLADHAGVEHAVTFNSGTSALVSALDAAGVGPGDEVVVPSFTFVATANAVAAVGARPVFADVEAETYGLDPTHVREVVGDDTAAIVPVHYAGCPCRIDDLREIAREHDLVLIEDAAEAQGAQFGGRHVGTFGDAGVLSFCQNKVVTTGEGGAVLTDDDELAERLRLRRSHGRASSDHFERAEPGEYVDLGYNHRMADVVASVGLAQMERVEDIVARRRAVGRDLADRVAEIDGVAPPTEPAGCRHVYQLFTVTFDPAVDRDGVVEALAARGVASKVYFEPVHLSAFYRREYGCEPGTLPTTEQYTERVLSLPMCPDLTEHERSRIAAALGDAVAANAP